ncbi:hypothetical protein RBQ61_16470 [Sedimentibacter sp. MB35-C1]|nr:hypothetical protein [Sedimentibacter sp. MB35-C1]WMJ77144.1 hypothetical protein RBQ61_16470 [Sedimentibacter sp. MB35-C1]
MDGKTYKIRNEKNASKEKNVHSMGRRVVFKLDYDNRYFNTRNLWGPV